MHSQPLTIRNDALVTDLVKQDYRTSSIFRKYGIDYCCGGKLPLQVVCDIRQLDIELIKKELEHVARNIHLSSSTNFHDWSIDFLVDYLINVHHSYLLKNLPDITESLDRFVSGHKQKYPELQQLSDTVCKLRDDLLPHLEHEETIIFPYIRQIAHAWQNNESYAALLVKTLRKPVESMMKEEHNYLSTCLQSLRDQTNNYTPPVNACISHRVCFSQLKELDDDLVQHLFLETDVLFSRAIQMEKELLMQITK